MFLNFQAGPNPVWDKAYADKTKSTGPLGINPDYTDQMLSSVNQHYTFPRNQGQYILSESMVKDSMEKIGRSMDLNKFYDTAVWLSTDMTWDDVNADYPRSRWGMMGLKTGNPRKIDYRTMQDDLPGIFVSYPYNAPYTFWPRRSLADDSSYHTIPSGDDNTGQSKLILRMRPEMKTLDHNKLGHGNFTNNDNRGWWGDTTYSKIINTPKQICKTVTDVVTTIVPADAAACAGVLATCYAAKGLDQVGKAFSCGFPGCAAPTFLQPVTTRQCCYWQNESAASKLNCDQAFSRCMESKPIRSEVQKLVCETIDEVTREIVGAFGGKDAYWKKADRGDILGYGPLYSGFNQRFEVRQNLPCTKLNTEQIECVPCSVNGDDQDPHLCTKLADSTRWQRERRTLEDKFNLKCPMPDFVEELGEASISHSVMGDIVPQNGFGQMSSQSLQFFAPKDSPQTNFFTCVYPSNAVNTPDKLRTFLGYVRQGQVAPCAHPENCTAIPESYTPPIKLANPPFVQGMPDDFAAKLVTNFNVNVINPSQFCQAEIDSMVGDIRRTLESTTIKSQLRDKTRTALIVAQQDLLSKRPAETCSGAGPRTGAMRFNPHESQASCPYLRQIK